MLSPITLVFYGEDDEKENEYVLHRMKTKLLKSAVRMGRELKNPQEMDEEQINMLLDFIVELFGNQFTREELEEKTDLMECFSVLSQVFNRAGSLVGQFAKSNPPVPSLKKK